MGESLLLHCLYSHHLVIAIVMGLFRYPLPMFLLILSTNMFLSKAEQSMDKEDERKENLVLGTNILEKDMDRLFDMLNERTAMCNVMLKILGDDFCKNFIRMSNDPNPEHQKVAQKVAHNYCNAMKATRQKLCQ